MPLNPLKEREREWNGIYLYLKQLLLFLAVIKRRRKERDLIRIFFNNQKHNTKRYSNWEEGGEGG